MFALDLLFWCVTTFTLLTLACSTAFVIYFIARKMFEMLFAISSPGSRPTRPTPSGMLPTSPNARMMVAAVDKNFSAVRRGIEALNAAAIGAVGSDRPRAEPGNCAKDRARHGCRRWYA